jgi:hypothetical protein
MRFRALLFPRGEVFGKNFLLVLFTLDEDDFSAAPFQDFFHKSTEGNSSILPIIFRGRCRADFRSPLRYRSAFTVRRRGFFPAFLFGNPE